MSKYTLTRWAQIKGNFKTLKDIVHISIEIKRKSMLKHKKNLPW